MDPVSSQLETCRPRSSHARLLSSSSSCYAPLLSAQSLDQQIDMARAFEVRGRENVVSAPRCPAYATAETRRIISGRHHSYLWYHQASGTPDIEIRSAEILAEIANTLRNLKGVSEGTVKRSFRRLGNAG
jgi:hypothetical protein